MTRDELLAALLVERYDNRWWKTPERPTKKPARLPKRLPGDLMRDDEVICAKRRRDLLEAWDEREREVG